MWPAFSIRSIGRGFFRAPTGSDTVAALPQLAREGRRKRTVATHPTPMRAANELDPKKQAKQRRDDVAAGVD